MLKHDVSLCVSCYIARPVCVWLSLVGPILQLPSIPSIAMQHPSVHS